MFQDERTGRENYLFPPNLNRISKSSCGWVSVLTAPELKLNQFCNLSEKNGFFLSPNIFLLSKEISSLQYHIGLGSGSVFSSSPRINLFSPRGYNFICVVKNK